MAARKRPYASGGLARPADVSQSAPRTSGGIGRRTGFRFRRRKAWRFDPSLAHEVEFIQELQTASGSCPGAGKRVDVTGADTQGLVGSDPRRRRAIRALTEVLTDLLEIREWGAYRAVLHALDHLATPDS